MKVTIIHIDTDTPPSEPVLPVAAVAEIVTTDDNAQPAILPPAPRRTRPSSWNDEM